MAKAKKHKFDFVDLFAGVGGVRLPFTLSGGTCVLTSEIDYGALTTYGANFKDVKKHRLVGDVTKIADADIPSHDLLLAGFPCQAYSLAGLRKGLNDPRGKLFLEIIRFLQEKAPKVFLLENVKGLVSHEGGATFKFILDELQRCGYHIHWKVMNTMKYGNVPQTRERVYLVGFRNDVDSSHFEFPEEIPLTKTVSDCLEVGKVDDKYYYDGRYSCFDGIASEVSQKGVIYQWRRRYVRKNKSGVCPTLTANMGSGGHNVPLVLDNYGIRKLTPRECARFQGFPESFVLPNMSDSRLYRQFGNSVSVPVIARVADKILEVLCHH